MTEDVIAVITVNYRTPVLVIAGLKSLSLERQQFPGLHVVVVDNDSGDGSFDKIQLAIEQQGWQTWVKLVAAKRNGGFAYGNNIGFTEAKAWLSAIDYFWLLNPDTEVLPGATEALLVYLQQHPRTIVGSLLQDRDGSPQVSTFNFPSVISEMCSGFSLGILDKCLARYITCRAVPEKNEITDWVAGASMMMSAAVQRELGGFDEGYFLYFEEVDYLFQAKKRGIESCCVVASRVIHEMGASTGIADIRKTQPRRPKYWFDSRRRYFLKNCGRTSLIVADLAWMVGYVLWLMRKRFSDPVQLKRQPPKLLADFFRESQLNPFYRAGPLAYRAVTASNTAPTQ